jgi:hypothetical protein
MAGFDTNKFPLCQLRDLGAVDDFKIMNITWQTNPKTLRNP